jgi:hypothetical protein
MQKPISALTLLFKALSLQDFFLAYAIALKIVESASALK